MNYLYDLTTLLHEAAKLSIPPDPERVPSVIYAAGGGAEAIATLQSKPGCSRLLVDGGTPYDREPVRDLVGRFMRSRTVDGARVGGATSWEAAHLLASAAWVRACSVVTTEVQAKGEPTGIAAVATLSGDESTREHGDEAYIAVRYGKGGANILQTYVKWQTRQTVCTREEQSAIVGILVLLTVQARRGLGFGALQVFQGVLERLGGVETVWSGPLCRVMPAPPPGDCYLPAFGSQWLPLSAVKLDPATHYLMPGSYRPLHHGHLGNRTLMDRATDRIGIVQVSRNHPVKGPVEASRFTDLAGALYGVADILVGDDDGRYADKVVRWGLDAALGTEVIDQLSDEDCEAIRAAGRTLLVTSRPGFQTTSAAETVRGFPVMVRSPFLVSSTGLRGVKAP